MEEKERQPGPSPSSTKDHQFDSINSEIVEQANSLLKHIKSSVSYMNKQNFINHCTFFLWYQNLLKK